jgi:excisionase family DNA binding protein
VNLDKQPPTVAAAARFLSVRGVAEELAVSEATVRRLVRSGELLGVRVGSVLRVPGASVEEYLEEQRVTER